MPTGVPLWNIERLVPYERNPRTHSPEQVTEIAASIVAFGFNDPIAVDGERGIVEGHGRLLAARQLGLAEVPVVELAHLTPTQRRAYMIAHNKLALKAGWDEGLLKEELEAIEEDGLETALTGFTDEELRALLRDDDAGDPDAPRGLGNAVISYTLVFDDQAQQDTWFRFIRWLKERYPEEDLTLAGRLAIHLPRAMAERADA